MSSIVIRADDNLLVRFGNQMGAVGKGKARRAIARALNRTTAHIRTQVVREVTTQSSIPRRLVTASIKRRNARVGRQGPLEGVVWGTGKPLSLKHFKAKQFSWGVRAKVQGEHKRYPGAFMGPRPGVIAPSLQGHVFRRTTASRLPIEMEFGPAVPEEMVRGAARRAYDSAVTHMLPRRVEHELGLLLP